MNLAFGQIRTSQNPRAVEGTLGNGAAKLYHIPDYQKFCIMLLWMHAVL